MAFADPRTNVRQLSLEPGLRVADFGAGSGAYALALAEAVSPGGEVYAVEVQKELLSRLEQEANAKHVTNLHFFWGDIESVGGSQLKDNFLDLVLLSNVLFQVSGMYQVALEAKRVLKPEGRVAVIEWSDSFGGLGPRAEDLVLPEKVKTVFSEAGLKFSQDFSAGDHHYGLIFTKV